MDSVSEGDGTPEGKGRAMSEVTELIGSGTVLQSAQHGPQLCFGLMESSPPQGHGPDVVNWDWSRVSGFTSQRGTIWGDYMLIGTFDGSQITMTRPPGPVDLRDDPSAAGDPSGLVPARPPNPAAGPHFPGRGRTFESAMRRTADEGPDSDAELLAIQREESESRDVVSAWVSHHQVCLYVVYDDGSLQQELDDRYGTGVVRVDSALTPYPA
jgi:hypothetical protein